MEDLVSERHWTEGKQILTILGGKKKKRERERDFFPPNLRQDMDSYELLLKNKFPPGRQGSENEVSKLGKNHFVKNKCSLSHP